MLVTIPFMCRVVSVHRLYTATSSPPANGRMSCSTVSDVSTASSASSCAWMSCGYLVSWCATTPKEMLDPRDPIPQASQTKPILHSLWGALLQAFTVEDVFQRKIK